jgi:superfamily I DNA and/or RNA helicase
MHPALSAFPNRHFYGGGLLDGVTRHQRPVPPLPWPVPGTPLVFLDTAGREETAAGNSKLNRAEAEVVCQVRHT